MLKSVFYACILRRISFLQRPTHLTPSNPMREYTPLELKGMTDNAILIAIGEYIRAVRLDRNWTQAELGERAGVHRTTVRDVEAGNRSGLPILIQLLRSLDQLHLLRHFKVSNELSPLELARLESKRRKRASRTSKGPRSPSW